MNYLTASGVAELIGFSDGRAFLRERDRLESDHDFPPPMPTCQRPLKWRLDAVQAWLDRAGTPVATMAASLAPNVVLLNEARRP